MGRLTPPQLLILSFLSVILLGTFALTLPVATEGPGRISLIDGLFTATSATCVTGLVVKDTGSYFSTFGRWIIFLLFQAGGLGIMTFSTLFAVLLGRKIGFRQTDVIKSTLDRQNILGFRKLIFYILGITITAEILGAALLFLRWRAVTEWTLPETLERAVFHSVSGFCNAGFSLFRGSFMRFESDPYINLTMMGLIFFGGIGFIVMADIIGLFYGKGAVRRLSLQSKIAITVSFLLIAAGALLVLLFERDNALRAMSWPQRVWGSLFQAVTARTAGFNTLSTGQLSLPTLIFLAFLMFVGASPGSTGGGIKTCTFAVVAATIFSMLKNKRRVMLFNRSIPRDVIRESLVIFFLALLWIFVFTVILAYLGGKDGKGDGSLIKYLFEVVSAFGTVGLSTGITGGLSGLSKLCIVVTMFAGRIGPLTLALAVAFRARKEVCVYPEENLMVG
ncbi:MAG: potassium transporter TrkG [Candidatus Omnitrophota bacterium]|nr:potassium transporter TrkG [Candidatus Omnitrophota bacterium]